MHKYIYIYNYISWYIYIYAYIHVCDYQTSPYISPIYPIHIGHDHSGSSSLFSGHDEEFRITNEALLLGWLDWGYYQHQILIFHSPGFCSTYFLHLLLVPCFCICFSKQPWYVSYSTDDQKQRMLQYLTSSRKMAFLIVHSLGWSYLKYEKYHFPPSFSWLKPSCWNGSKDVGTCWNSKASHQK